jgi:hypothetical protein
MVGGFQIHRHAELHGNVRRVRQERGVNFFRGTDQERELARLEADGVAEEAMGVASLLLTLIQVEVR